MLESGDEECIGINEIPAGVFNLKQGSAGQTPYVHGAYPNENTWIFYRYTGVDEDFEVDFTFEQ